MMWGFYEFFIFFKVFLSKIVLWKFGKKKLIKKNVYSKRRELVCGCYCFLLIEVYKYGCDFNEL